MSVSQWRVGLATLGCKVSQYETEAVAEAFERLGFVLCPFENVCDVYVINTCTVTAESDRKSRQVIRRALRRNPHAVVMAMGCSTQNDPASAAAIPGIAYICGSDGKMKLPQIALDILTNPRLNKQKIGQTPASSSPVIEVTDVDVAGFEPMCITRAPRTRAYVKIEDGCECRCTYCAIPLARGPVRSKVPDDVVTEVRGLIAGGIREVVLTGIEIASYGRDLACDTRLVDLVERLDAACPGARFRLGSLTPEIITSDFAERISRLPSVVPHFHLSVQSGSDTILRAMHRRYLTDRVLAGMADLRRVIPGVQFTCDMMVGFPGETDELFAETVSFTRAARFLDMHIFIYSLRPGTPAASLPGQVDGRVAHVRSRALIELASEIRREIMQAAVDEGTPLSVLFETLEKGGWYGHSDSYIPVRAASDCDLHAEVRRVIPFAVDEQTIVGRLCD